VVNIFGKE